MEPCTLLQTTPMEQPIVNGISEILDKTEISDTDTETAADSTRSKEFCITCGTFEDDLHGQPMLHEDETNFCSEKCAKDFKNACRARMENSTQEQKQAVSLHPTGKNSEASDAKSVHSMTKEQVVRTLRNTAASCRKSKLKPYDLQPEIFTFTKALRDQYTAKQAREKVDIFLQFLLLRTEICPTDRVKDIQQWGRIKQSSFADMLGHFASQRDLKCTSWGKTVSRLFEFFAQTIWPKTTKKDNVIKKARCLYGLRLTDCSGSDIVHEANRDRFISTRSTRGSGYNTPDISLSSPGSSSSISTPDSRSSDYSPYSTPVHRAGNSMTFSYPTRPSKSRRSQMHFEPFYDILENGECYVVRIFTPVMAPDAAGKLQIKTNLAEKKLTITGAYIPGCIIGDQLVQKFGIHKPLISSTCSEVKSCGYMNLEITLPTDIKDDEESMQVAHAMWGLAIHFPRRKQIQDVSLRFTSCFGTCNLDVEHTEVDEIQEEKEKDINLDGDTDLTTLPPRRKKSRKRKATVSHDSITSKQDLIKRKFKIRGEIWDQKYAGKMYELEILKMMILEHMILSCVR